MVSDMTLGKQHSSGSGSGVVRTVERR